MEGTPGPQGFESCLYDAVPGPGVVDGITAPSDGELLVCLTADIIKF